MMTILSKLCRSTTPKLPLIMICNMITTQLKKTPCPLQVTLGTVIREKEIIQQLHKFGVVCSYDEVLRFRKSAAIASKQVTSRGLVDVSYHGAGLVQVVVDNFDANISSQNGWQSTHALALLLTQTCDANNNTIQSETIPRIRKEYMTTPVDSDLIVHRYNGPKKPDMPQNKVNKLVPSLKVLASQEVAANRPFIRDFQFLSQFRTLVLSGMISTVT